MVEGPKVPMTCGIYLFHIGDNDDDLIIMTRFWLLLVIKQIAPTKTCTWIRRLYNYNSWNPTHSKSLQMKHYFLCFSISKMLWFFFWSGKSNKQTKWVHNRCPWKKNSNINFLQKMLMMEKNIYFILVRLIRPNTKRMRKKQKYWCLK